MESRSVMYHELGSCATPSESPSFGMTMIAKTIDPHMGLCTHNRRDVNALGQNVSKLGEGLYVEEGYTTHPGPAQSFLDMPGILKVLAGAGMVEASSNCLNIIMVAAQAGAVRDVTLSRCSYRGAACESHTACNGVKEQL